jgi:hypothetical protein
MALNQKEFNDNLNRVVSWTNKLMKESKYSDDHYRYYGTVFRQTHPVINGQPLFKEVEGYGTWNLIDNKISIYKEALQQALIPRGNIEHVQLENLSELGRILSFEIGLTTHEGLMIIESDCFFDESDVPPIDTWFYLDIKSESGLGDGILYCWIPKPFIPIVQHALKFEVFKACEWFNSSTANR